MQAFKRRKTSTLANPPSKKRKVTSEIEEITFDFSAREDYLTGTLDSSAKAAKPIWRNMCKK